MADEVQKRVLVVDDEEAVAKCLAWQLEQAGFHVRTAYNGRSALDQAASWWPDLVVLDLRLPDLHGYQVSRELRKLRAPWAIPVVMCTGLDQPMDQLRGFAYGADAYLTKPVRSTELVETIELLLGQATAE